MYLSCLSRYFLFIGCVFFLQLIVISTVVAKADDFVFKADFPGGAGILNNVQMEEDGETQKVDVGIPSTLKTGWRIWWSFKIEDLSPGQKLHLNVDAGTPPTKPRNAVWSTNGQDWHFLTRDYIWEAESDQVWFAWSVPYVLSDAKKLFDLAVKSCPNAKKFTLANTRQGRIVPGLRFAPADAPDSDLPIIWIQARQHAWETGASWVADGFVRWLISDNTQAKYLLDHYIIYVVPIMDVDSVQLGLGGKNQKPHDHNRDWVGEAHWPAVAAAKKKLLEIRDSGDLKIFFDIHNPGWKGRHTDFYLLYEGDELSPEKRSVVELFERVAKESFTTYPMRISDKGYLKGAGIKGASGWVLNHFPVGVLSLTPEIPVKASPKFKGNPPAHHQSVGDDMGHAIFQYLMSSK